MREALVVSAIDSAARATELGLARRADRAVVQGVARAGPHRRLSRARAPLRLRAASRAHRGGHGEQGHRRLHRGDGRAAAARHRRHDPRVAHAGAQRRPHEGSPRRAGNPADDGPALVRADGRGVSRLRAHHQHGLPGAGRADPGVSAGADAGLARALSRRRVDAGRGDGLRRQRARRVEARQYRHLAAGHGRVPGGAGVRRRREDRDAPRRRHRGGIPAHRRRLRPRDVRRRAARRAPFARAQDHRRESGGRYEPPRSLRSLPPRGRTAPFGRPGGR